MLHGLCIHIENACGECSRRVCKGYYHSYRNEFNRKARAVYHRLSRLSQFSGEWSESQPLRMLPSSGMREENLIIIQHHKSQGGANTHNRCEWSAQMISEVCKATGEVVGPENTMCKWSRHERTLKVLWWVWDVETIGRSGSGVVKGEQMGLAVTQLWISCPALWLLIEYVRTNLSTSLDLYFATHRVDIIELASEDGH